MAVQTYMTAEQFDALPEEEGRNWELLDGELIEVSSPTPKHNRILARLLRWLDGYAESRQLGVVISETDLAVRHDARLRPDLCFFSAETWSLMDIERIPVTQTPDIAIEIISPSETARTIQRKVDAYLQWGVLEIWLIDAVTRMIVVHSPGGVQPLSEGAFLTSEFVPGWRLQVADLFENL